MVELHPNSLRTIPRGNIYVKAADRQWVHSFPPAVSPKPSPLVVFYVFVCNSPWSRAAIIRTGRAVRFREEALNQFRISANQA